MNRAAKDFLKRFALVRAAHRTALGLSRRAWFAGSFRRFRSMADDRFRLAWSERQPMLHDRTASTGFDEHYLFHTAWAARILAADRPERHVDIGSCLYFVALVSAFLPLTHYDYRPPELDLDGLGCLSADLTALPFGDGSLASLSCMHVVEHIGLGRYGDPLDPDGDLKAAKELARVLAPGGRLLFAAPVGGVSRIKFNAHRIYTHDDALALFPDLRPLEFALVTDQGRFVPGADPGLAGEQEYGCGCWLLAKEERP